MRAAVNTLYTDSYMVQTDHIIIRQVLEGKASQVGLQTMQGVSVSIHWKAAQHFGLMFGLQRNDALASATFQQPHV